VLYGAKGAAVQIVVDGRIEARQVRTGLSADGFIQVEGVRTGDLVVTRAGSFLRDGDAVRPVIAEAAQAEGTR
jgi:HlyD family secretion protein